MGVFTKNRNARQVDTSNLPRHIAVIMDGNGRWAKKRGLPRSAGHKVGAETFRTIATYCKDIGVDYLTVYAFSTENWKRPAEEIEGIMGLLKTYLLESIDSMVRDGVRLKFFGDLSVLSDELKELIERTNALSETIDGFQANVCLNYGGRDEIVRAARSFACDCVAGEKNADELTESAFSDYLDSADIPDPELLIRPGGEVRISNFLLWQCAYSEIYVTDVLWPDFTKETLNEAIAAYQKRDRRFGGVK